MGKQQKTENEHKALTQLGIKHKYDASPQGSAIYFPSGVRLSSELRLAWSPIQGLYVPTPYTITFDKNVDDRVKGFEAFKKIIDVVKSLG